MYITRGATVTFPWNVPDVGRIAIQGNTGITGYMYIYMGLSILFQRELLEFEIYEHYYTICTLSEIRLKMQSICDEVN